MSKQNAREECKQSARRRISLRLLGFYLSFKKWLIKYGVFIKIIIGTIIITVPLTFFYLGLVKGTRTVEINQLYQTAIALRAQELKTSVNVLTEQINVYRGTVSTELWNELKGIRRVMSEEVYPAGLTDLDEVKKVIKKLSLEYPKYEFTVWNQREDCLEAAFVKGKVVSIDTPLMDYLMEQWPTEYYRDEKNELLIFVKIQDEIKGKLVRDVTLNVGEELGRLNAHMGLIQLNPSDSTEVGNYFGEILFSTHPYPIVDDEEQMRQLQEGILTDIKESFDQNKDYCGFYRKFDEKQDYFIYAHKNSDYQLGILLTMPTSAFTSGVLDTIEQYNQGREKRILLALTISSMTVMTAFISGALIIRHVKMKEIIMEKRRAQMVQEHNEIIFAKYERINEIAHDVKNHMCSIKGLIELGQSQSALEYIEEMYGDLGKLSKTIVTGNQLMDVILNEKFRRIKRLGIGFDYKIERVSLGFINDKDLTILLTNLLDNAIESCQKGETKKIEFQVYTFNEAYVIFKVTNSCHQRPITVNNYLMSQKREGMTRGYGIRNIERVASSYSGMTLWKYDESSLEFQHTVTLPLPLTE